MLGEIKPNAQNTETTDDLGKLTLASKRNDITAKTLANAAELITRIVSNTAGNDVSTSLGGDRLTNDVLRSMIFQRISENIETMTKGVTTL